MTLRISSPEIQRRGELLELSARIVSPALPAGLPQRLVYAVAANEDLELSVLGDTFLVGAMPLAMKLGEDLEVAGTVSLRLALGIEFHQDMLTTWFPGIYRRIAVNYEHVEERAGDPRPKGVGCCFSGGTDSFNAVMELLPPRNRFPPCAISHAVMVNGFDQIVDLEHGGVARRLRDIYTRALEHWQVRLIMIHSNLKLFRDAVFERRELSSSFGSPLTACAHALAPVFGRFCLSGHATYRFEDLKPMGSHPALDHHLSSDQLQVIHLGARLSRSEKLEMMAAERPVRETLRVCFETPAFDPDGAIINCGVCEKCVRTVVMLDILGLREHFPTFRNGPPIGAYRNPQVLAHIPRMFLSDLLRLAHRRLDARWCHVL